MLEQLLRDCSNLQYSILYTKNYLRAYDIQENKYYSPSKRRGNIKKNNWLPTVLFLSKIYKNNIVSCTIYTIYHIPLQHSCLKYTTIAFVSEHWTLREENFEVIDFVIWSSSAQVPQSSTVLFEFHITCPTILPFLLFTHPNPAMYKWSTQALVVKRRKPSFILGSIKSPRKQRRVPELRLIGEEMTSTVPLGFRFYPTEEELIGFYLQNKLNNRREDMERVIPVADVYCCDPWQLPREHNILCPASSCVADTCMSSSME